MFLNHMPPQMCTLLKSLYTDPAHKGCLSSVQSYMRFTSTFLGERFLTVVTFIWSFSSMDTLMAETICGTCKEFSTIFACSSSLTFLDLPICVIVWNRNKGKKYQVRSLHLEDNFTQNYHFGKKILNFHGGIYAHICNL